MPTYQSPLNHPATAPINAVASQQAFCINTSMKASISRIALFSIIVASSPLAQAANENFPDPGRIYDVIFAENARQGNGQIKVIRKGEGSWILVEYTTQIRTRVALPAPPGTPQPSPEEPKTITKKLWVNTQWIVSASESEAEKK